MANVHVKVEQGTAAAQIFIDDGVGGTGHKLRTAQSPGETPGEGSLPGAKIAPVGNDGAGLYDLSQGSADFFRLRRGIGDKFH